jgi:hypothetical protein
MQDHLTILLSAAHHGRVEQVQSLVDAQQVDINFANEVHFVFVLPFLLLFHVDFFTRLVF